MSSNVDRPDHEICKYKNIDYLVKFKWGEQASMAPTESIVEFKNGEFRIIKPEVPWNSYEDALKDVKYQTENILDRQSM